MIRGPFNTIMQMLRLLRFQPRVEVSTINSEGRVERVGISLWEPDASFKELPKKPPQCAICGDIKFNEGERLSALLMPRIVWKTKDIDYLIQVWVHPLCFEACIETSEPDPIPW